MRRKTTGTGTRPWLLGTNDIPPPLRVPWQMWSQSSDPHQQGLIVFEFTEEGLAVDWWEQGVLKKPVIPWHELAWCAGQQSPALKREIEWLKEQAETEGYKLARQKVIEDVQARIHKLDALAEETGNPFFQKYRDGLEKIMQEVKEALR